MQLSHGCIFRYGFNYVVGRVYPGGRVVVDLYEVPLLLASRATGIWSCDSSRRQRTYLEYGAPAHRGRLVQHDRVITTRTHKLGAYDPRHDPWSLDGQPGDPALLSRDEGALATRLHTVPPVPWGPCPSSRPRAHRGRLHPPDAAR